MKDSYAIPEQHAFRLETLVKIRWLAVIGQTIAVLFVAFILKFNFQFSLCLVAITCSAWLNVVLRFRFPRNHRLSEKAAIALLAYDILQLTLLLYLTGGLQNPFAILLVVPVIISATIQPIKQTLLLGALVVIATSLLVFFKQPLPWRGVEALDFPLLYVAGVWVAIISSLMFTVIYVFRVADESRKLAEALAATELVLQREQHLSTLDGLAAAAAHELGTPLATIALVSKEMIRELKDGSPMMDDAKLLRSQAERCRQILQKLTSLSGEGDNHIGSMPFSSILEEVSAPHRDFGVELSLIVTGDTTASKTGEPICRRNPAIIYGLGNLVENAVDFAKEKVKLTASWDADEITLQIRDDGHGFSIEVLNQIGEPFVTTRGRSNIETGGGLGLGLFIAKTLLERSGATIIFGNVGAGQGEGAIVSITWPREAIELNS
ncbi:MAG: ActS/PrrB/RegB family redox-sensitive histidine kinase [Rhizobiaceae bacterium]|nr:ActS/PrrB/RegB family redox-sensitive histidine kinase [Rhizobiaceae bacterium]